MRRTIPQLGSPSIMKSTISPTPPSVKKRVTRTAVPGRYSCLVVNASFDGRIEKRPPFSVSRIAPNRLGASKRSGQNQSIVPSLPTSATVWRSPMIPWCSIGR